MLPLEMSGGESSEREKEGAKSEQERQRRMRKRSETKTGLNVGGITEVWGSGEEGGGGYRSIPGLIRTIFRSRGREAIFFPGSVDEKRLRTRCHAEMMGK